MTTLSTGFDYFGVCDLGDAGLPCTKHKTHAPAPAPAPAPEPVITPHLVGQWRTYRETSGNIELAKMFVSVYRETRDNGYIQRKRKTKVQWYGDTAFRNSYSNQGDGFILRLMPEGHAPSPL